MRIPETRSEDLPPMRVNTVTMFVIGICVWVVALVVVLVVVSGGRALPGAVQICLTGIGIGILALGWAVPRDRRQRKRTQQSTDSETRVKP